MVSDRKIAHSSNSSMIDYYTADVISAQDYYPFGMIMPGRVSSNQNSYRYGFNGKENDKEIEGQQDYGMRIYDGRLGRFKSIDPISNKYPELTPYQFASNRPIDGIDLDGLEYLSHMSQYKYTGSGWDYFKWIPNAAGNIYNGLIADTWNSGVTTVKTLGQGTYLQNVGSELRQVGNNVKQTAVNSWNYTINTPISQQFVAAGRTAINPQTWESALTLIIGSKLPLGAGKGSLVEAGVANADKIKFNVRLNSSEAVNKIYTSRGFEAPYAAGSTVAEFQIPTKFDNLVRLSGPKNVKGDWFTTMDQVKDLSPAQLRDKFSLKYEPTQITPVTLSQGSTVRVGTAAPVNSFNTNGGGFQIELLNGQAQYGTSVPLKKL
jgi:RHS repeat-associated protein